MPKRIRRSVTILLLLGLLGAVTTTHAQTCLSEAEIPSSTPTGDFTDFGDGTVTHNGTGLMWTKCPLGQSGADCASGTATGHNWKAALEAAADSTFAGHANWRVPNLKELRSIVERRCFGPAVNQAVFPATPAHGFWSSSPNAGSLSYSWIVLFYSGNSVAGLRSAATGRVRLVRSVL